jgi:hypothetical protein
MRVHKVEQGHMIFRIRMFSKTKKGTATKETATETWYILRQSSFGMIWMRYRTRWCRKFIEFVWEHA